MAQLPNPDALPLPPTAQVIAEVIGREDTLKIARVCKCRHFYVPHIIRPNHWLYTLLGEAKAKALQREFCGLVMDLAKCRDIQVAARNRRILKAHHNGKSLCEIAAAERVSTSTVSQLIRNFVGKNYLPAPPGVGSSGRHPGRVTQLTPDLR